MVNTVETSGIVMEYITFGSGKRPFVILPGLSVRSVLLSAPAIKASYKQFEKSHTVYVFDRRKNIPKAYTVYDMANDTAKAMRSLGIRDADIFGASQGGMMAQIIAIEHPELVHKLVLGSTASRVTSSIASVIGEWIEKAEEKDKKALTECSMRAMYSENTYALFADSMIALSDEITDNELEKFVITAKGSEGFDVYDRLNEIKAEILVIGSYGDRVLTPGASEEIAEKTGCRLYMYGKEYGHCVYDEAPDYKQRMIDFFNGESV